MSKAPEKLEVRVNGEITAPQVRLIDQDGKQAGVVSLREALNAAREKNLDLVEVSPTAKPPVCRILDWGKYHYTQMKRARESRRAHQVTEMKEVRLRPKTNEYHAGFKVEDARRFLKKKMKVRFKVQFRGREITYPEIALKQLKEVAETLHDIAEIEQKPNLDGRTMVMVLTPRGETMNRKAEPASGDAAAGAKPAAAKGGASAEAKPPKPAAKKVEAPAADLADAAIGDGVKADAPAVVLDDAAIVDKQEADAPAVVLDDAAIVDKQKADAPAAAAVEAAVVTETAPAAEAPADAPAAKTAAKAPKKTAAEKSSETVPETAPAPLET